MFKISKNVFYLIGMVILFSKMFACADSGGGGCIPLELIPEGYRAQQYQQDNIVLTNVAQVRVTQTGFDYVKDNIGEIIKSIMPDMYMEPDSNGNARVRICVPPQYGVQVGFEYGVASACDENNCDVCGEASGSNGSLCPNTLRCFNNDEGSDLIITLLKNSLVLEAQDDGTDADKIYGSVSLSISNIPFWTNGVWPVDNDDSHTVCNVEILNDIPVSLDIDFTINTLNPAETSFDITNINYNLGNDDLNIACPGLQGSLINLVKGIIVDQITPTIDEMINSLSDTLLCAKTVPVDNEDLNQGFQCPMNAPASATAGVGCSVNEDCAEGYTCQSNLCKTGDVQCDLYNTEDPTTENYKCVTGYCNQNTGQCVDAPFCMESANTCWKTKLGIDGRIDIMAILGSFIETTTHSWINFYLNLGHYAKSQSSGISIGLLAGTSSDFNPCVTPTNKDFNKIIPEISMFNQNTLNGNPYHIGIGVSEYFVNQLLDSAYNGGALCLDIDSKVSSMITTDLFGLLIPSINDLTSKVNSALMIAIRPQKAPIIKIGPGNTDSEGNILINEALVNVKVNDLNLDFYAFLNDRYVRIFTTIIDLNLGINLDVDGEGKLIPVLAPIKFGTDEVQGALNNLRVENAEILRETNTDIVELLPGVVELALGMVPLNFAPIALPSFMGFGIDIKDITQVVEGNDDETQNFIGIFADILIGVAAAPQNITFNSIMLENKIVPRIKNLRKGKNVLYTFMINSDLGTNIEYQYRINKGFWSSFKKGNIVKVNNSILKLQGKYNIDIRARKIGDKKSLSKITTKTIIVDAISPEISIKDSKNIIKVTAIDNISSNIKYSINIDDEGWKTYNKSPIIKIPENQKSISVKVKAIDESGNETIMNKRFNFDNRMALNGESLQTAKENTGCSYGGTSDKSVFFIFLIAIIALLSRKKNLVVLLMASFTIFFYGCSDSTQKGACKNDTECDAGKICVEDICVTGNRCEDNSEEYECQDCYIPGRCSEPTGDNPCNEGCECNTTFGQCFPIDGFCVKDDDCNTDYECKDNRCSPKRCGDDNDCAYMADQCTGDHSHPVCNQAGACTCFLPCDGGCPTGKFCCLAETNTDYNQCLINPVACEGETCDPGYSVQVTQEGSIDDSVSCDRVGVQCDCVENPHLKLGTIGLFANSAIWNDGVSDKVIVVGYNSLYGDLVLGVYDQTLETLDGEHITWSFIDGVLNDGEDTAEITNGPTGPRGGISQKGIDVGLYTSVAVDGSDIHISYYDKEHKSLRYALVKKHTPIDETDKKLWDVEITTVDQGGDTRDTGYYTSITVNNGIPSITYMVKDYKDGNDYKSSLNIAVLQANNTWSIMVLDSDNKNLPCNNSCTDSQKCLFNEDAVLECESNLITKVFDSTTNNLTITDNNTSGISSLITIPSDNFATEFRISYNITHNAAGQLKVVLVSPEGREYLLVNQVTDPSLVNDPTPNGINIVNQKLSQIKDIDVGGVWALKVYDTKQNIQGTLNNWSISIKTKVDNSPYCGSVCQETQETCNPACSSLSSEICAIDGICKVEAKEVTAKYYINGVGLFNKSIKLGNNIGILYYDSINGSLKFKIFKPSLMTVSDSRIIDSGKVGRNANFTVDSNLNAHITYRDKAGDLRYLEYALGTAPSSSLVVDDGLRILDDGKYSIHKIGSDSLVVENGVNEYDIYYYDATSREIVKKHYKKSTNELDEYSTVFQSEEEDATYEGSFGFYLNYLKFNSQDVFTTFYYRTQVGQKVDAEYNKQEKPNSLGKVRVINK